MLADLLNQNITSNFSDYNKVIQPTVALTRDPAQTSMFCNKLVSPSRDIAAIQKIAKHDFSVEMKPVNEIGRASCRERV